MISYRKRIKRHFISVLFDQMVFPNDQIDWKVPVVEILVGRGRALNFSRCFSWIICIIGLIAPYICHFKQMTMAKNFERLWKHKKHIANDEIFIPRVNNWSVWTTYSSSICFHSISSIKFANFQVRIPLRAWKFFFFFCLNFQKLVFFMKF